MLNIPLRPFQRPLDPSDEVKIAIKSRRVRQFVALQVRGGIANPGALRPELVAAGAGQGACADGAPRTAVFRLVYMTIWEAFS